MEETTQETGQSENPESCAFHVGSQHFPPFFCGVVFKSQRHVTFHSIFGLGQWDGGSFLQNSCGYFKRQPHDSQPGVQTYTKMGYYCADWGYCLSWKVGMSRSKWLDNLAN